VSFSLKGFRPPGPSGGECGAKPAWKPSMDRCGCAYKISLRSVQGFGFPSALHIPTDKEAFICTPIYTY